MTLLGPRRDVVCPRHASSQIRLRCVREISVSCVRTVSTNKARSAGQRAQNAKAACISSALHAASLEADKSPGTAKQQQTQRALRLKGFCMCTASDT